MSAATAHIVRVDFKPGARYPWRPSCSCGAPLFGYLAEHAAVNVAEGHVEEQAAL